MREVNPQSSPKDHAYRFKGKGWIRFSNREYAQEYIDAVNDKVFINLEGHQPRQVSAIMAEKDLEFKLHNRPTGPKFYDDIWHSYEGVMEDF